MVKKYADLYLEARQTLIDAGEIPREAGVLSRQLLAGKPMPENWQQRLEELWKKLQKKSLMPVL